MFEILSVVCKETVSGFRVGESIRYGDYTQNADSDLLRLVHLGPSEDNTLNICVETFSPGMAASFRIL